MSSGSKMAGAGVILTAAPNGVGPRGVTTIEEGFHNFAVFSVAGIVAVIEHLDDGSSVEAQLNAGIVPESFFFLDAVAGLHQVLPRVFERHFDRAPLGI